MADCPETVSERGQAYQVLDPTRNGTYEILGKLLKELGDLAPDAYFHLGGDEVYHRVDSSSTRVEERPRVSIASNFEQNPS